MTCAYAQQDFVFPKLFREMDFLLRMIANLARSGIRKMSFQGHSTVCTQISKQIFVC